MKKTYITNMPDRAGALLEASKIIALEGGNITRINYNKAVDLHTLFIDVEAKRDKIKIITEKLREIGYLTDSAQEGKVILIKVKIEDEPGFLQSVLNVINKYDVNISYINSGKNKEEYRSLKMGLFIENPIIIKCLLDELSHVCDVKILDYSVTEKTLDSTVFYISFADEIRQILNLNQLETSKFIVESNRIMQILENRNEKPFKTFEYIKKFAEFISTHRGDNFNAIIERRKLSPCVNAWIIEPPCGSNVYILDDTKELLFIDGGFRCFLNETLDIIKSIIPDFDSREKRMLLTHADIDHAGLMPLFDEVFVSDNCRINLELDYIGDNNFREQNPLHAPYCRLSKIISEYIPTDPGMLKVIGTKTDNEVLSFIGNFKFSDMNFEVYEGNGGHVKGETVFYDRMNKVIFTGDNFVNAKGFSQEQAEFNSLAPYLMTSVNVDSEEAKKSRRKIIEMAKGCLVCPGHGMWEQH